MGAFLPPELTKYGRALDAIGHLEDPLAPSSITRLKERGHLVMSGQIVDASIVAVPRQRMTDAEKQVIWEGRISGGWQANPHKLTQKDRDARWTLRRDRTIGLARAEAKLTLANLAYNFDRLIFHERCNAIG